jgi:DNA polymerase III gamma/tau subunit
MSQCAGQFSADQLVRAIRLFNQAAYELRTSAHPTLPLEIALVETTLEPVAAPQVPAPTVAPPPRRTPPPAPKPEARATPPAKTASPSAPVATVQTDPNSVNAASPFSLEIVQGQWTNVLARVKQLNRNAEALLRSAAEPIKVEGDVIVLGFQYQVHAEKFEKEPKWKENVERSFDQILQRKCRVKCMLAPERAKRKAVEQDPLIRTAINQLGAQITEIHGGA